MSGFELHRTEPIAGEAEGVEFERLGYEGFVERMRSFAEVIDGSESGNYAAEEGLAADRAWRELAADYPGYYTEFTTPQPTQQAA